MKKVAKFFDKLEDKIRVALSHHPISYSFIGGIGVVLFWRGVWVTADDIFSFLPVEYQYWSGPISILVSVIILLMTGLFVSFFITDRIILSGLTHERKLAEKTEEEVRQERNLLLEAVHSIEGLSRELKEIKEKLDGKK